MATIKELARQTIRGDFGVGQERRQKLGAQYDQVQAEVNAILRQQAASRPAPAPVQPAPPPPVAPVSAPSGVSQNPPSFTAPDFFDGGSPFIQPQMPAYTGPSAEELRAQREAQQQSAFAIIQETLANYGLTDLTDFVNKIVFEEDVVDANVVLGRLRQTTQYKQRFAGNEQRRTKGLNALSESEYVAMERVYMQYFRASGLPEEMYDQNTDVQQLIANDVSVAELATRINQGYEAVRNADPQVINEMRRLYGVTEGQLAAYFLDPTKAAPVLVRQAESARIAGQGRLQAGIDVTQQQAEGLAIAGINEQQAREGFQAIQQAQELFTGLIGEENIGQEEQIAGVFGTSAAAQQRIRQRQRGRQAAFEQGGRFAGQGSTLTGLQ
jgi:hypothetical protein